MQNITSLQNPIIKTVHGLHRKKIRQEAGVFLIEGFKGVEDAINYGLEVTHIFLNEKHAEKMSKFPEDILYLVNEKILKKISTTDTHCEVLAVAKQFKYETKDLLKAENPLIIVLEDIKDPGNLGTIIRTAKAANTSGIVLTGETADIFNPKTVRSTVGNLWKIPIVYLEKDEFKNLSKKLQFIATTGNSKDSYFDVDYKTPTAIMFGSEAEGLSEDLLKQTDITAKIPMNSEVESLNLSVSVGVVLYEALRQRL